MDSLEQHTMLDFFQGLQGSESHDVEPGSLDNSFLDLLNLPDMLSQGFDHLSGLPLDGDGLELDSFNEREEEMNEDPFDPVLREFISEMQDVFAQPSKKPLDASREFDVNANLALPNFEESEKKPIVTSPPADAFSTIKRLWPEHVEKFEKPKSGKKVSKKHSSKPKRTVDVSASSSTGEKKKSKKLHAKKMAAAAKVAANSASVSSNEESMDEVDIETVDDDEMNGKSGAEILSHKLQSLADFGCDAARVREVVINRRPKKIVNEFANLAMVVPLADLEPVICPVDIEPVSPKKIQEVLPVLQSTPTKSPLELPNHLNSSLLQTRRESLLRLLPKGARIKPRSKDSSPSSIVEKIKQSSQAPRSSILIPYQEKPLGKTKGPGKLAVVTPFIPPPLTVPESKPTIMPGVISEPIVKPPPKVVKSVHIGAAPAPVYKLTSCASSTVLKLSSVPSAEPTGLPQVRISTGGTGNQQQFVTLTASQTTSLLQNLHKLMPKAVTTTAVSNMSKAENTSSSMVKVPAELVKTVNELSKSQSVTKEATIIKVESVKQKGLAPQAPMAVASISGFAQEMKNTQKVAPILRQQIKQEDVKPSVSYLSSSILPLPSKLDHDYCNQVTIKNEDGSSTATVDPWTAAPEPEPMVIDSEGVGQVVTVKTDVCDSEVVVLSDEKPNSPVKGKMRRDSASSLASSQRSKHHRSSCSPSNSSSSHSVYCRSRSRSPAGYGKTRRSRSRGRHTKRNSNNRKKYSSSRSPVRSRGYSPSRSPSWDRRNRSRSWLRSRSRSRSRSWSRGRDYNAHKRKFNNNKNIKASRSPYPSQQRNYMADQMKQIEERRVIYVGKIPDGTTKTDLRQRFFQFGDIQEVSVHFRDVGDNYAFVTFAYKSDAYEALEHGNDDTSLPRFDLCFGGRRQFCKRQYSDLDSLYNGDEKYGGSAKRPGGSEDIDFDTLLRTTRAKLVEKKTC